MIESDYQNKEVPQSFCCSFTCKTVLVITAVALVIIGVLAALDIGYLGAISNDWFYFELAATTCLALLCCCPSSCVESPEENEARKRVDARLRKVEGLLKTNQQLVEELHQPRKITVDNPLEKSAAPELFFISARHHLLSEARHPEFAFKCLCKARDLGHEDALFYIGQCYERGEGVDLNNKKAAQAYETAAKKGHIAAIYICMVHALKEDAIFNNMIEKSWAAWAKKIVERLEVERHPDADCRAIDEAILDAFKQALPLLEGFQRCKKDEQKDKAISTFTALLTEGIEKNENKKRCFKDLEAYKKYSGELLQLGVFLKQSKN